MKRIISILACALLAAALAGCEGMTKQDVGVATGGVIGGLVGSQFGSGSGQAVAIAAGAITGALIGGAIGNTMDKVDQQNVNYALEHNRTNAASSWKNPDTGNQYTVKPVKTYQHEGRYCREYLTKAIINGKEQTMYGKACRQPDGSWKVVK